ncbi:putative alpha amylase [Phaeomoniella chlamydospora]|uniref:alpha-amylase n=1 Tax=Phaeomoniella chlamydospora TaxID=158046 RepID=A0A0G2GLI3_PHACM|nr:putative alpha amylase [Phaeomoniella chlamydospora]
MGFDAIWISPIKICSVQNIEGDTDSGYAYHGYWTNDPFELNSHFGTADDLLSLSDAVHARNMSIMLDVVINHFASNTDSSSVDYSAYPSPFNTASAFHQPPCSIDYSNQTSAQYCWLVVSPAPSLPDIDTEDTDTLNPIVDSVVTLVETYSFDGIRLDTVKQLPPAALSAFQSAVGVMVTGENYDTSISYVASYQSSLDSLVNYPLYWPLIDAFNSTSLGSLTEVSSTISNEEYSFSDINVLTTFLDNPDQPRFASVSNDITRDQNAITFTFLHSGIPVVYYGFEQRLTGLSDPDNRNSMWSSGYSTSSTLYTYIHKLHSIRTAIAASDPDFFTTNSTVIGANDNYLALQRGPVLFVVTNIGASAEDTGYTVPNSQWDQGTQVLDLINCETATVGSEGGFESGGGNGGLPRYLIGYNVDTVTKLWVVIVVVLEKG